MNVKVFVSVSVAHSYVNELLPGICLPLHQGWSLEGLHLVGHMIWLCESQGLCHAVSADQPIMTKDIWNHTHVHNFPFVGFFYKCVNALVSVKINATVFIKIYSSQPQTKCPLDVCYYDYYGAFEAHKAIKTWPNTQTVNNQLEILAELSPCTLFWLLYIHFRHQCIKQRIMALGLDANSHNIEHKKVSIIHGWGGILWPFARFPYAAQWLCTCTVLVIHYWNGDIHSFKGRSCLTCSAMAVLWLVLWRPTRPSSLRFLNFLK